VEVEAVFKEAVMLALQAAVKAVEEAAVVTALLHLQTMKPEQSA
jgi:hypothetical protein